MTLNLCVCRLDHDAQLLANRIALLKQEEMKTWKKIEDAKKRTNDIAQSKKRNEEKVQKVTIAFLSNKRAENLRPAAEHRRAEIKGSDELRRAEAAPGGKEKDPRGHILIEKGGSQAGQSGEGLA